MVVTRSWDGSKIATILSHQQVQHGFSSTKIRHHIYEITRTRSISNKYKRNSQRCWFALSPWLKALSKSAKILSLSARQNAMSKIFWLRTAQTSPGEGFYYKICLTMGEDSNDPYHQLSKGKKDLSIPFSGPLIDSMLDPFLRLHSTVYFKIMYWLSRLCRAVEGNALILSWTSDARISYLENRWLLKLAELCLGQRV